MRPFNIEEAKAGKPVCTRNGKKVRILCFDKKSDSNNKYPIIALVDKNNYEEIETYNINGRIYVGSENELDLMMDTIQHNKYIIIFNNMHVGCNTFDTYEDAEKYMTANNLKGVIAPVNFEM